MDLRRIRIDNFGLLTQSSRGKMERILLQRPVIDRVKGNFEHELGALLPINPSLAEFLDGSGHMAARVDVADEEANCLTSEVFDLRPTSRGARLFVKSGDGQHSGTA